MNTIKGAEIIREYSESGRLSSKAVAVFTALVRYSNKKNTCFPSLNTLHKDTGLSKSSVQMGLKELLEEGLITKKHNFRADGSQTSNIYSIIEEVADRIKATAENQIQKMKDLLKKKQQESENRNQCRMDLNESSENNCEIHDIGSEITYPSICKISWGAYGFV